MTTPSASPQGFFGVKLEQPAKFCGEMDLDVVESWVFQVENFFALSGMVDENVKARYSTMLLQKSAAIWLRNKNYNLSTLHWTTLKQDIKQYFRPADYHRRARDQLANCVQTGPVSKYIDAMKRHGQRVAGITDDEMLDRFIRGLKKNIQREVLKDNPKTFADAAMLAERMGRLDDFVGNTRTAPQAQPQPNTGWAPMELDSAFERRRQPDRLGNRDNRPTCYCCGKKGHFARDCYHRSNNHRQVNAAYQHPRPHTPYRAQGFQAQRNNRRPGPQQQGRGSPRRVAFNQHVEQIDYAPMPTYANPGPSTAYGNPHAPQHALPPPPAPRTSWAQQPKN